MNVPQATRTQAFPMSLNSTQALLVSGPHHSRQPRELLGDDCTSVVVYRAPHPGRTCTPSCSWQPLCFVCSWTEVCPVSRMIIGQQLLFISQWSGLLLTFPRSVKSDPAGMRATSRTPVSSVFLLAQQMWLAVAHAALGFCVVLSVDGIWDVKTKWSFHFKPGDCLCYTHTHTL